MAPPLPAVATATAQPVVCTSVPKKERLYVTFLVAAGALAASFWGLAWWDAPPSGNEKLKFGMQHFRRHSRDNPHVSAGPIRNAIPNDMPHQHRSQKIDSSENHQVLQSSEKHIPNSCDLLLGAASLTSPQNNNDDSWCVQHSTLTWTACQLSPLYIVMNNDDQSASPWRVHGEIPSLQVRMPLTPNVQNFVQNVVSPSAQTKLETNQRNKGSNQIWNILVFREVPDDLQWNLMSLYQTHVVLWHWENKGMTMDPFRIVFMDNMSPDSVASNPLDDLWNHFFGFDKVVYWQNLTEMSADGRASLFLEKSILVPPSPSALGEEAVNFYQNGDTCQAKGDNTMNFLQDFVVQLGQAHGVPPRKRPPLDDRRRLTLLYDAQLSEEPVSPPNLRRAKQALQKLYNVTRDRIYVAALGEMSLVEQIQLLGQTNLLIHPQNAHFLMSIFLPKGAQFLTYHHQHMTLDDFLFHSRRLKYLLHTLGIEYKSQPMPLALQSEGIFGQPVGSSNDTHVDDDPRFNRKCDELLGWDVIQKNGTCHTHTIVSWTACEIPPLRFYPDRIAGALGNESLQQVMGRNEADERLVFSDRAVESLGVVNPSMTLSCRKMKEVQNFWKAIYPLPSGSTFPDVNVDKTPTMLVFRESYANPCWSIMVAYQTWLMTKLFGVGENFRILWMDGHAYTSIDEFWHDVFGAEVYHFQGFVHQTGITAFERPYVVHSGRLALGNEALHVYHLDDPCSPNSTLHEFRSYVLHKYGYSDEDRPKNATKRLTFLIRKPYIAHPRAVPIMDRTVHDVAKTVAALRLKYPDYQIETVHFEGIPFREQLAIIRKTDLLVSVHGAGNIHVLFLPRTARFVEFYPPGFFTRQRFQYIASALNISRMFVKATAPHRKVNSFVELSLEKHIQDLPMDF